VEKTQARQEIRRRLDHLTPEQRLAANARIRALLADLPEFQQANTVLLFVSMPDEVDTLPILADALAAGKTVALPKVDTRRKVMDARVLRDLDRDLAPGVYGILEPQGTQIVPPETIDFVLVPARGFDRQGNRLGRGGGYYDRYMSAPGFRATRCGIAYSAQLLDTLPHAAHDLPVHLLVTEAGILRFAS